MIQIESFVELNSLISEIDESGLPREVKVYSDEQPKIKGIASLDEADHNQISFLSNPKFFPQLATTKAAAVVLTHQAFDALSVLPEINPSNPPFAVVICEDPYLMYSRLTQWFYKKNRSSRIPKIHSNAVIDTSVDLGENLNISTNVVIEENSKIADSVYIGAGCYIGKGVHIGENTLIHPNVTIYDGVIIGSNCIIHSGAVIGSDGFGFAPDNSISKGGWSKIYQLGTVVIEDDVEIGANTCIDRGALKDTLIKKGAKLDNLIMIAHNCQIGQNVAIAACVGIAGSTTIGDRCTLAGAAMVSGHLNICDDAHISGGTGVMENITKPGRYTGLYPIEAHKDWQKNAATLKSLHDLRKRVMKLEKLVNNTLLSSKD